MEGTNFEQQREIHGRQEEIRISGGELPEKQEREIGVWGNRRKTYLKNHRKIVYAQLVTTGSLREHLLDTEEEAAAMFERLVRQMAEQEGITEQLKADDPMTWVRKMNNIRNTAKEFVNNDLIYV